MLSLKFKNVYINDYYSIIGPNKFINVTNVNEKMNDYYFEENTFEQSQIKMESKVINELLKNNNVELIFGGDLSNQLTATYYGINKLEKKVSTLGLYAACSTFIESTILAALFISNNQNKKVLCVTSSHALAAERQFRYPVEYGQLRNRNSTLTATASVGCILSSKEGKIKVIDGTIGIPIEKGITDPNYIGAIMAPSAKEVIINHLNNNRYKIEDFDLILTGDLGKPGIKILKELLNYENGITINNLEDAGEHLFKRNREVNSGASGPAVLPLYFFYNILK